MPQFWLLDSNWWSLFFLTDYKILINVKVALLKFSMFGFNTVDRHFGISLQHVLMKKVLNQTWWFSWWFKITGFVLLTICINHIFHSQVGSIFCWDEKVDRKKNWVVQFLLYGPTLNFWPSWWPVNLNFEACSCHKMYA